jgi:LAO/AO transport system kinase
MAINPHFPGQAKQQVDMAALEAGVRNGNRQALAQAITLVESEHVEDRSLAAMLLSRFTQDPPAEPSFRLGITGNPGAGKSTLIEALGQHWIDQGEKVAVLAIDPSSSQHFGSILGDKTRMEQLSKREEAFIRPSPSAGALGGIHRHSPEVIALFEAAGYRRIIIETVGVGQNETSVQNVVDLTLLIALPGAGDEVQGLKRGVMEAADLLWVNKADGDRIPAAKLAASQLKQALGLFHREDDYVVEVLVGSATTKDGMSGLWEALDRGMRWGIGTGRTQERRAQQREKRLQELVHQGLWQWSLTQDDRWQPIRNKVISGELSPAEGALEFLRHLAAKNR